MRLNFEHTMSKQLHIPSLPHYVHITTGLKPTQQSPNINHSTHDETRSSSAFSNNFLSKYIC